ncbi:hypothetical protein BTVI_13389 [Pitangus sulphuratus]|nr:hypothetical protein BTVI_13389 [Pitangus sulphuratus]
MGEYEEERQESIDSSRRGGKALGQQELKEFEVYGGKKIRKARQSVQEGKEEEGFEVDNTNARLGKGPEALGQLLERTKGESQNVPIWQSEEQ